MTTTQAYHLVLIVDDDDAVRWMLAEALNSAEIVYVEAENEAEALRILWAVRVTVAIVDFDLGHSRYTGIDLLNKIRLYQPDIPVVLISAQLPEEDAMRAGAVSFLQKPFSTKDLLTIIRPLLP